MAAMTAHGGGRPGNRWRIAIWGAAAFLLLLPLAAMRFTAEVNWTDSDFIAWGAMLLVACGTCELAARLTGNRWYRAGVGAAVAAAFLIVWANGAVGMIGSEDNPYNLLFFGVIALALAGAIAARFRPAGLALDMAVAAAAHGGVSVFGMFTDM